MCFVIHYEDYACRRQSECYCCKEDYRRDVFIPKNLVVAVTKYDSFSQHSSTIVCEHRKKPARELHLSLVDVFSAMGIEECECTKGKSIEIDTMDPECKGIERLYPLYLVRVKNLYPEENGTTIDGNDFRVMPVCSYYLHPCEKEHMERYLAGTDDPMYDFVHELRYNPRAMFLSPDLQSAREDFEGKKRRRQEEDD